MARLYKYGNHQVVTEVLSLDSYPEGGGTPFSVNVIHERHGHA
jgi:hypothetical protein